MDPMGIQMFTYICSTYIVLLYGPSNAYKWCNAFIYMQNAILINLICYVQCLSTCSENKRQHFDSTSIALKVLIFEWIILFQVVKDWHAAADITVVIVSPSI